MKIFILKVLLYKYGAVGCSANAECGQNMVCNSFTCTCVYPFYWDGNLCSKNQINRNN